MTRPRQASWKVAEPGFQLGWSCPKLPLPLHRFLGWANKIRTFTQIWSAGSPFVRSEWIRFKGGALRLLGCPSQPSLLLWLVKYSRSHCPRMAGTLWLGSPRGQLETPGIG